MAREIKRQTGKKPDAPEAQGTTPPRRWWPLVLALLPMAVFTGLGGIFLLGLGQGDPGRVPSALIGKPAPEFDLPALDGLKGADGAVPGFATADLKSHPVTLVNVWASWCGPCRAEHPVLSWLKSEHDIRILGLNYKDKPEDARRFLGRYGNPYAAVGVDRSGAGSIDWGVYGVPETFVVDAQGRIRHKHIGPLGEKAVREDILPLVTRLKAAAATKN